MQAEQEAVVVTGKPVNMQSDSAVIPTRTLERDALVERGATNLGEALQQESGIQVNSALGTGQEIYMDGLDGRHVLILVDGRPVSGRVDNWLDPARLPVSPSDVERIEVVRGPMRARYGS